MKTLLADVAIIGGGVGGCAAALAALEAGCKVVLTEETDWLGGQFTSQLVPPDEHGWIERFGRTASYQKFRAAVRAHYLAHSPLAPAAKREPRLNPGNSWVSPLSFEPSVAVQVLRAMFEPYLHSGRLHVVLNVRPAGVAFAGAERIDSIALEKTSDGARVDVKAEFFLDATELGDLLELAEVEHVTGQESKSDTAEPSAPAVARPLNQQAFTWCFAIEHIAGANFIKEEPRSYGDWRKYRFPIIPPWPGPLLSWRGMNPRTLEPITYRFEPNPERKDPTPPPQQAPIDRTLWTYRRIIDRHQFLPGVHASDVTIVNWPMNDYIGGSLIGGTAAARQHAREESRQLSLALLYWMQTEAPRPDGGCGWPGLRLRPDVTGTADGLAKTPYVREARRIRALTTVREQDVSAAYLPAGVTCARSYDDSVGVGAYRIDLHPSLGGDNFIDVPALPFQIPLGALIPLRIENLIPAAKNIGTTHLTNGCFRLHPVEWNIGEAAGALAAFCIRARVTPQRVHGKGELRDRYRAGLAERGVEMSWPQSLSLEEGDPHIHAKSTLQETNSR